MNKLIYIIDDEEDILKLIDLAFSKDFFDVKTFANFSTFIDEMNKKTPDLILLDLMLPNIDGFQICKLLKAHKKYSNVPIIILSAKSDESDKVFGLECGADDYLTKPFSIKELITRVKVVLKRCSPLLEKTNFLEDKNGKIKLESEKFCVSVDGENIKLTKIEFKILELLLSNPGLVFSREKILHYLWGDDKFVTDRTVDVHIKNLREKLKDCGSMIKNIHGIGYKFESH